MDDNAKTLKIKIKNQGKNNFRDLNIEKEIGIDEIKKECNNKFNYQQKDLNNIILYFVDKDDDINLINNFDELFNLAEEDEENNLSIEIISKLKTENENNINDDTHKNNKINDNGVKTANGDIGDVLANKDKEIEELKNVIYNLTKKNENDSKRNKNLLFYYEEFIKPTKKGNEKENNKKNEAEKKENKIHEIKNNENKNGNNIIINENENKENKINEIENNRNEKENNHKNNKNGTDKKENNNNPNFEIEEKINEFRTSKTFELKKLSFGINDDIIQNDKSLKKENPIEFEDIEFINEKCSICKKKIDKIIYKDYTRKKIFLCEKCFKNDIKKDYKDNYFLIKFPKNLIQLINERKLKGEKLKGKPIQDFNKFLNNIFFDNEGNFSKKEINDKDFSELKRIYDDMKIINEDPIKYIADYQVTFINKQKLKMDDNERNLIDKKLKLVMDNLAKITKNKNFYI